MPSKYPTKYQNEPKRNPTIGIRDPSGKIVRVELPPINTWGSKKDFQKISKNGKPRCQQFSKIKIYNGYRGAEAQCQFSAHPGYEYCKHHANLNVKRGKKPITLFEEVSRYRKHLPKDFLVRFIRASKNSVKRLELNEEIDLLTARLTQILERLDTKQSAKAWAKVQDAYDILVTSIRTQDAGGFRTAVTILNQALSSSDYLVWHDILNLIQHRKSLVESERRRYVEQSEIVTITELMALVAEIQSSILSLVKDQPTRIQIASKFAELVGATHLELPERADSGGHGSGRGAVGLERLEDMANVEGMSWKEGERDGCSVCKNNPQYRQRRANPVTRIFICPNCKTKWVEPEELPTSKLTIEQPKQENNNGRKNGA